MFPRIPLVLALVVVLGALLGTACGPTCPTSEPNCGTPNAPSAGSSGTNAGAAGSSEDGTTTCAQLTAVQNCMDAFCKTTMNPFCTCYQRGFDIRSDTCKCSTFSAAAFCKQAADNGIDAASYDCSAATGAVASICVGVQ